MNFSAGSKTFGIVVRVERASYMNRGSAVEAAVEIGQTIRAQRREYNVTQKDLAQRLDMSEKTLRAIERGSSSAKLESTLRVITALGLQFQVRRHTDRTYGASLLP